MKPNQPCNYLNRGHKPKVNILGQYERMHIALRLVSKIFMNTFFYIYTYNMPGKMLRETSVPRLSADDTGRQKSSVLKRQEADE